MLKNKTTKCEGLLALFPARWLTNTYWNCSEGIVEFPVHYFGFGFYGFQYFGQGWRDWPWYFGWTLPSNIKKKKPKGHMSHAKWCKI